MTEAILQGGSSGGGVKGFIGNSKLESEVKSLSLELGNGSSRPQDPVLPYNRWSFLIVKDDVIHLIGCDKDHLGHYVYKDGRCVRIGTLPFVFEQGTAVMYHGLLHVFGGTDSTEHYYFDDYSGCWIRDTPLPYGGGGASTVVFGDRLFYIGGKSESDGTKIHYLSSSTWIQPCVSPYPFMGGRAVVFRDALYLLGSVTDHNNTRMWEMVLDSNGSYFFSRKADPPLLCDFNWQGGGTAVSFKEQYILVIGTNSIHSNSIREVFRFSRETGWGSRDFFLDHEQYTGSCNGVVFGDSVYYMGYNTQALHKVTMPTVPSWETASSPYYIESGCAVYYQGYMHLLGGLTQPQTQHLKFTSYNSPYWDSTLPPMPVKFERGCAVECRNRILTIGGYQNQTGLHKYTYYGSWSALPPIPFSFYDGCAVEWYGKVHILGGESSKRSHWYYDVDLNTWNEKPTQLPYDFVDGCSVVYKGELHILGGRGNTRKHFKYNNSAWTDCGLLPFPFWGGLADVRGGVINIYGGYYDTGKHHAVYNGLKWLSSSTLPFKLRDGAIAYSESVVHLLGGDPTKHIATIDNNLFFGATYAFSLDYNFLHGSVRVVNNEMNILGGELSPRTHCVVDTHYESRMLNTLPYDFKRGSSAVLKGEIHILGGFGGDISHYKLSGDEWINLGSLPVHHYEGRAEVINDEIHLMGGNSAGGKTTNHYKYTTETGWTQVGTIPGTLKGLNSSVVIENVIYISCTKIDNTSSLNKFINGNWESCGIPAYGVNYATMVPHFDTLYQQTANSIVAYDKFTKSWTTVGIDFTLLNNSKHCCACSFNKQLNFIGGNNTEAEDSTNTISESKSIILASNYTVKDITFK